MPYQATTATKKIVRLKKRIRGIAGGTSASKTVSIILHLINEAQSDTTPTLTSIVSESFPHLRRGAMRDFLSIMQEHKYFKDNRWSKTDFTYSFETGSQIEFFSADQAGKVRGPRRDRLFINEANNVPFETFEQLEIRTRDYIFADWNPTNEFWFYTDVLNHRDDVDFITLTYLDNEALDEATRQSIESRKHRKNWWKVYGLGQLGDLEGKIFTGWNTSLDEVPHEARLEKYGLDFGYSNHPTAIVAVYYYNGGYILDEILYKKGLSNRQLADVILNQEKDIITVADSAEPKSIDEIMSYGVGIIGAKKGRDSIMYGIQKVQDYPISVTKRSLNILKEYRNYLYKVDKDGKILNEPEDLFNHAMDAVRYVFTTIDPEPLAQVNEQDFSLYSDDYS